MKTFEVYEANGTKPLGTVDFDEPLGTVPWRRLERIRAIMDASPTDAPSRDLVFDWSVMALCRYNFPTNIKKVLFTFKATGAVVKRQIPDVRWCKCGGSVDFVRCNLVCSKCRKSYGGIS